MLGELNELQIKNVLSSQALGRMACAEGELPYIIPVTYAYDGDFIYGQTNEGKKLDILRKNPNVCFEVDSMFDMRNWQCAIVHGKFEELSGLEADNARELLFNRVFPLKTSIALNWYLFLDGLKSNNGAFKYKKFDFGPTIYYSFTLFTS